MLADDDLLPLSGLQHLLFCERQCALIHIEGIWVENRLTAEGRLIHTAADLGLSEARPGIRIARGLALRSERLGLVGRADVVEFREGGTRIEPFPVEYKRGRRRRWLHDEVQLCAQAVAVEEMTGLEVQEGAIFYGASRRRLAVRFDVALRKETERAAAQFHTLVRSGAIPRVPCQPKCRSCSLLDLCQPHATYSPDQAERYLDAVLRGGS